MSRDGVVHRGNSEALVGSSNEEIRSLFKSFEEQVSGAGAGGELDPEVEKALRALGYVK